MRRVIVLAFLVASLCVTGTRAFAQLSVVDSLRNVLRTTKQDTARVKAWNVLSTNLRHENPDTAMILAEKARELATSIGYYAGVADATLRIGIMYRQKGYLHKALEYYQIALNTCREHKLSQQIHYVLLSMGTVYWALGDYAKSLAHYRQSLDRSRAMRDSLYIGRNLHGMALIYAYMGDTSRVLHMYKEALVIQMHLGNKKEAIILQNNIGHIYRGQGYYEKALQCYNAGLELSKELGGQPSDNIIRSIGTIHLDRKEYDSALRYFKHSLQLSRDRFDNWAIAASLTSIGIAYNAMGMFDSALVYGKAAMHESDFIGSVRNELFAYKVSYTAYKGLHLYTDALGALEKYLAIKDSVFSPEQQSELNRLLINAEMEKQSQQIAFLEKENELQESVQNSMIAGVVLLCIIAGVLYRQYRYKRKTSDELQASYDQLKRTQKQLIHAEKMATLGELTAGVAHEMKNPLNFISNFSSINDELLRELREGTEQNRQETDEVLDTVLENNAKLSEHSRRADGIVNSMLMHSRETRGIRKEVDINTLVHEAVELARHGTAMSAGVQFTADLDSGTGSATILPAEISRVVLNLAANALYEVHKKEEDSAGTYRPHITVTTRRLEKSVALTITDNGGGMSGEVQEKIFQPFFTTKPTGEGTGLGLSLCWDIVVNGHNGTIEVESEEGNGAMFTVILPVE